MKNKKIFWSNWHTIIFILVGIILLIGLYNSYTNMIIDEGYKPSFYDYSKDINFLNASLVFIVLYLIVTFALWFIKKNEK